MTVYDNAATEVPGVRVLELINQLAVANGENKAYVLPLMCGTGKSSVISLKIREYIERNEGLLVLTDRKDRLASYLKPGNNDELYKYLQTHTNSVAIMTAETVEKFKKTHHLYPILLMTTQRYFRLTVDEIKEYLNWDGGKRGLVLIDEKPELISWNKLDIKELRKLYDAINLNAMPTQKKEELLNHISKDEKEFFSPYNVSNNGRALEDYTCLAYHEENEHISTEESPTYRFLYDREEEYFNNIRHLFCHGKRYRDIPTIFDKYNYLRRHKHLVTWLKRRSEIYITKCKSNAEKITDIGATVIVLDGTADYSAEYYRQDFLSREGPSEPDRTLPNLHVRLINANATSRQTLEEKKEIAHYAEYIRAECGTEEEFCIFTFKSIKESFETDEEGNLKKDMLPSYLGNNRGRNDLQKFHVIGQVGVLFPPPYRYLEIMLLRNPLIRERMYAAGNYNTEFFKNVMQSNEYNKLVYRDVLVDIEQNIFRSPIRSPDYNGNATYYIFFRFDKHPILKNMIFERFEKYYKAKVTYVEKPDILLNLLEQLRKDTNVGKVLRYLDAQPIGKSFTSKDIMKNEEVNLTATQFSYVKDHPVVLNLLKSYCINENTGPERKMTRFRKNFDIREINEHMSV